MKADFEGLGAREIKRLWQFIQALNETENITGLDFGYNLHYDEPYVCGGWATLYAVDFDYAFDCDDNIVEV